MSEDRKYFGLLGFLALIAFLGFLAFVIWQIRQATTITAEDIQKAREIAGRLP